MGCSLNGDFTRLSQYPRTRGRYLQRRVQISFSFPVLCGSFHHLLIPCINDPFPFYNFQFQTLERRIRRIKFHGPRHRIISLIQLINRQTGPRGPIQSLHVPLVHQQHPPTIPQHIPVIL